jgi:peptidoglycan/LPS O-acetylase OafA/YrhL
MMTTGVAGFLVFWYFAGGAIVRMLLLARAVPGRVEKGIAVYGFLMLASLFVFALLDQGFLSMRTMIFVGILLGAVFALPRLTASEPHGSEPAGSGGGRGD